MFLTETWLNSDGPAVLIETSPPCYSFESSTRHGKNGSGTASIFADDLNCRNIPIGDFRSFEHHAILLKSQRPVLVITIYRPPKQCLIFLDDFTEMLSIVRTHYDNIMVIGDFNLHVIMWPTLKPPSS